MSSLLSKGYANPVLISHQSLPFTINILFTTGTFSKDLQMLAMLEALRHDSAERTAGAQMSSCMVLCAGPGSPVDRLPAFLTAYHTSTLQADRIKMVLETPAVCLLGPQMQLISREQNQLYQQWACF